MLIIKRISADSACTDSRELTDAQDRSHHRRTCEDMEKKLKAHERNCFAFAALRTEFPR